jgi:hypothetical protein
VKKLFLSGIMLFKLASAQTLLPGDFVSNCGDATKMSFNSDGTFSYLMEGHMTHVTGTGFFRLKRDTVILSYNPDTIIMPNLIDTSQERAKMDTLIFHDTVERGRPKRLLMVDQSKLYVLDSENKIYKGSCLTQKEYFLERNPDFHIEYPQPILEKRKVQEK